MAKVRYFREHYGGEDRFSEVNRESRDILYIGEGDPPKQEKAPETTIPAIPV